jgi:hypothetical protein
VGKATVNFDNQGDNADQLYQDLMRARADLGAWASVFRGINQEDPFYYELSANGPLLDQSDETMRGMSVYTVDAAEARRLAEQDPVGQRVAFGDLR